MNNRIIPNSCRYILCSLDKTTSNLVFIVNGIQYSAQVKEFGQFYRLNMMLTNSIAASLVDVVA